VTDASPQLNFSAKEPYFSAKEPYIYLDVTNASLQSYICPQPYLSATETYFSVKEPYFSAKEPYI